MITPAVIRMPVEDVERDNRAHTRHDRVEDHQPADDSLTIDRIESGQNLKQTPAADELIAGDGQVGNDDGNGTEQTRGGVVPGLEDIGHRVLGYTAHSGRQVVDDGQTHPGAGTHPESGEAVPESPSRTRKQTPRSDPGADQGRHQKGGRHPPAGDHEVVLGLDLAPARDADKDEEEQIDADRPDVDHADLLSKQIKPIGQG
jgi:hypothetical protein